EREIAPFPVLKQDGTPYPLPFLGGFDHPRPQLVDIDGDGRLELFLQEYNGKLGLYSRTDSADGWRWRTDRYQGLDIGEWYRFVDVDGDGKPDLFAESPYSYIRYFHNVGTRAEARFVVAADTLKDITGTPIYADRQNIAQFVDIDCNGRLDMMLGRVDGTITRYEMVGLDSSAAPRFRLVTTRFQDIQIIGQRASLHGANTMAIYDIDEDGDPDILWGDFFEPGLLWLRNVGTCARFDFHSDHIPFPPEAPLETSGYNAPAAGDLNGDGHLDLIVGVLGGAYNPIITSRANLYRLDWTGPLRWTVRTDRVLDGIDLGTESVPAFVDLDGDGDSDLVVGTKIEPDNPRRGGLYWFENTGSRTAPVFRLRGELEVAPAYHYALAFGDLDGDGRPDLVLGQFRDAVAWYRRTGTGADVRFTLVDSALVRLPRGSNAVPTLVDIDGDGDLDLFVGQSSGRVVFFRNDGTRTAPRFTLVSDDYVGEKLPRRTVPRFADLYGDGRPALIVGTETGMVAVYRNRGTPAAPVFARDTSFALDLPPYAAPAFADLFGRGTLDFFAGGAGGGLVYYRTVTGTRR
ncbi:MAG TPA: FG-GAP and VCBS repeat-containing protein, partial [Gemmatimonadales bacterium]|nr:FG-GAP and VCBS repeat-containing protein [Gemmatimonadales bacterium]